MSIGRDGGEATSSASPAMAITMNKNISSNQNVISRSINQNVVNRSVSNSPRECGTMDSLLATQKILVNTFGDTIESLLSMAIYFVPCSKTGIREQFLYSLMEVFSLYKNAVRGHVAGSAKLRITNHAEEEISGSQRRRYTILVFLLRSLRAVQISLEMRTTVNACMQGQDQLPTNLDYSKGTAFCLRLEIVKLVIKWLLSRVQKYKILCEDEVVESILSGQQRSSSVPHESEYGNITIGNKEQPYVTYVGARSGRVLHTQLPGVTYERLGMEKSMSLTSMSSSDDWNTDESVEFVNDYRTTPDPSTFFHWLIQKVMQKYGGMAVRKIGFWDGLYHIRPIVTLLLLTRGKKWTAWWCALLLDVTSYLMLSRKLSSSQVARRNPRDPPNPANRAVEEAELIRRRFSLFLVLFRSPFFDKYFPWQKMETAWSKIPVLGSFNIIQLLLLWRPYYFYTSGT